MITYIALTITSALLLAIWSFVYWKYKDFPPGPYGLPLLGYAPFLGKKPHVKFGNLAKKYGKIFSVNLGGQQTVVVNDYRSITEAIVKQGNDFSSRPFIYIFDIILQGKCNNIVASSGAVNKELKRITMKILKKICREGSLLEKVVVSEVEKLATHLKTLDGQLVDMPSVLFIPILNVVWGITSGETFDINDSEMRSFADSLRTFTGLNNIGILNIFPFLRFVAPELTGYTKFAKASNKLRNYVEQVVDKHFEEHAAGQQTDLIHAFIEEIDKRKKDNMDVPPYCKDNLVGAALDMFVAGAETVNTTLHWAYLLMAYYPDIQKKVQRELDEKIVANSYLPYSVKSTIPYTEATLCEIQRFATISPFGIPHYTKTKVSLLGFEIPKNTSLVTDYFTMHNQEDCWGDNDFRPERFLNEEGQLIKHDPFMPFSAGPRGCPGESTARLELILFFSNLMRRFSFEMDPNRSWTSESPLESIFGMTLKPLCTSLVVKCR